MADSKLIYTLKSGAKTIGFYTDNRPYVIGFRQAMLARQVQYTISHDPKFEFYKDDSFGAKNAMYSHGKLKLQKQTMKSAVSVHDDVGLHMQAYPYNTFLEMPFKKGVGIIIPHNIEDESEYQITFNVHAVGPFFDSDVCRAELNFE